MGRALRLVMGRDEWYGLGDHDLAWKAGRLVRRLRGQGFDVVARAPDAELSAVLDEVERVVRKRMHGGVWMSEERVLAIIAELRREKP